MDRNSKKDTISVAGAQKDISKIKEFLELLCVIDLYRYTNLSHKEIAGKLKIDNHRIGKILKGVNKNK